MEFFKSLTDRDSPEPVPPSGPPNTAASPPDEEAEAGPSQDGPPRPPPTPSAALHPVLPASKATLPGVTGLWEEVKVLLFLSAAGVAIHSGADRAREHSVSVTHNIRTREGAA